MKNVLYLLCIVVVAGLLSSSAQALTPIGPPAATLDKGQFAAGFDYTQSKTDIEISGYGITAIVPDCELNTKMANLVFGISKDLELQIDLGTSSYEEDDVSSSGDFAWGFVLRSTFAQQDKVKWGVATSAHWYEASGSGVDFGIPWTETDNWCELQFAVGPSYSDKRFCLYGGPFLHFIDGEAKGTFAGIPISADFEQDSIFGGFIGARIEFAENMELGFEYLNTGSAQAVGLNIRFRF